MGHVLACPRIPVVKVQKLLPPKYLERLEQDQKLPSCCRHPENHEIEAWYSSEEDAAKGVPDIYVFICTAVHDLTEGKPEFEARFDRPRFGPARHTRFCVGGSAGSGPGAKPDYRPFWEVR